MQLKANGQHMVVKSKIENSYDCSCNCFVRNGILCCHALKVMLNDEVDRIPDKYILRRWRRDLVPVECEMRNIFLSKFVDQLQEWDTKIDSELPIQSHAQETTTSIKEFLGVSQLENIDVLPPTGIRNKGYGTGKRLISTAQKAITNGKRQKRKCRLCRQMATHDSRNCPKRDST
ncbi:Zinc finger, PMZ-type [Cynara cardunculus var. scolymus]|uniref:Zinc finger, PMZ-type n=1 Tax=Cynara cardunculus var. scolymus TaxID=59895 RepID=A0A103XC86_CYNCS|nr:Zinc finger, PMZ-type [Cynara cardunculus var. scolymus]